MDSGGFQWPVHGNLCHCRVRRGCLTAVDKWHNPRVGALESAGESRDSKDSGPTPCREVHTIRTPLGPGHLLHVGVYRSPRLPALAVTVQPFSSPRFLNFACVCAIGCMLSGQHATSLIAHFTFILFVDLVSKRQRRGWIFGQNCRFLKG